MGNEFLGAQPRIELPEIPEQDLLGNIRKLKALMDLKSDLQSATSEIHASIERLQKEIIPDLMDEQGIERMSVAGIGNVSQRSDLYVSIPAGKKTQALEWMKANDLEGLISHGVNANTLKAWAKEYQRENVLPKHLFNYTPYVRAIIKKS